MAGFPARARRPVFALSGQVLNAATNVATVYIASLLLRPDAFGRFALAFAVVTVVLAAGRGLVGSAMQVELPVADPGARTGLVRSAVGFTTAVGVVVALLVAVPGDEALVWFAPWIPLALLQDAGRYAFLAVARQGSALLLDVAWAVVQGLGVGAWLLSGHSVTIGVLASFWGLGALAGFGLFAALSDARPASPRRWLRATRDVAGWFTAAAVTAQVELYLVLLLTGTLLGAAEAGGLRAVQLLAYQPALVLLGSLAILFTPRMVRAQAQDADVHRVWWTILVACSPVAVALAAVALLREPLMGLLFPQYVAFAPLVLPIALQGVCSVLVVPSGVMLRGARRGRIVVVLQTSRALAIVAAAFVGARLDGADGLAWGLAAASAASLALTSLTAWRGRRRPVRRVGDRGSGNGRHTDDDILPGDARESR